MVRWHQPTVDNIFKNPFQLTQFMVSGVGRELDNVERHPQDRGLAQRVQSGNVVAFPVDFLQDPQQLLVVVVFVLKLRRTSKGQSEHR